MWKFLYISPTSARTVVRRPSSPLTPPLQDGITAALSYISSSFLWTEVSSLRSMWFSRSSFSFFLRSLQKMECPIFLLSSWDKSSLLENTRIQSSRLSTFDSFRALKIRLSEAPVIFLSVRCHDAVGCFSLPPRTIWILVVIARCFEKRQYTIKNNRSPSEWAVNWKTPNQSCF